jgi:hypothetical protein
MPRKHSQKTQPSTNPTPTSPAPVIHPRQVFDLHTAERTLGLKPSTLPREIRLGRLRYCKRGGKVLILGRWLLAWLQEAGTVRTKERAKPLGANRPGRLPAQDGPG